MLCVVSSYELLLVTTCKLWLANYGFRMIACEPVQEKISGVFMYLRRFFGTRYHDGVLGKQISEEYPFHRKKIAFFSRNEGKSYN